MLKHNPQAQHPQTRQRPGETRPITTIPTNDDDEKKKQVPEPDLGEGEEQGVRIEDVVRGHEEETPGESKPQKGFRFPQRLRERKRKEKRHRPEKEKGGTTDIVANRGQVLKGTKPNNIPSPETKKTKQNTQHPAQRNLTKKPDKEPTMSRRTCHRRVAGPMGRPAPSEETPQGTVVPRGPRTPSPREPPPVAQ